MIYVRVKELAEERGLSQLQLAQRAGLATSTVRRLWLDPHARTNTKVLDALSKALNIDASELIRSE